MNPVIALMKREETTKKRILVVGDRMTDIYIHGVQKETCQEGCPKFIERARFVVPGGSENTVRSLSYWRTKVDRPFTQPITSIKTRYIADGRCVMRHDEERLITPSRALPIHQEVLFSLTSTDGVILSDYDKGTLTSNCIRQVIDRCRDMRIPCVVDAKRNPHLYEGAIIKCNSDYMIKYEKELGELTFDVPDGNGNRLVVTGGDRNPITWDQSGPRGLGYDLPPVRCANHVGAGDCFAAHLTLALVHGFQLHEAAAIAHSAGRVYVQHHHNRPPRPDEVAADYDLSTKPARCERIASG